MARGTALTDRKQKKSKKPEEPGWKWIARGLLGVVRQLGNSVIWAFVCIYAIFEIGRTLRAFAGRASFASLLLSISSHVKITVAASVTVSIGMTGLYLYEYRRHRKTRERLTGRISRLELRLDPNRSSSGISPEGTTRIGDL
jgi:hypothetical protein